MSTDTRITALAQRVRDELNSMKAEYRAGGTASLIPRSMGQYVRTGAFIGFAGATTTVHSSGNLLYRPFRVGLGGTVTSAKVNVSTAAASSTVVVGLYAHDATTGLPAALLTTFGTADTSTTGAKTLTISQALTNDTIYWLGALALGGSPTMFATDVADPLLPVNAGANAVVAALLDFGSPKSSLPATADARYAAGAISKMTSIVLGA